MGYSRFKLMPTSPHRETKPKSRLFLSASALAAPQIYSPKKKIGLPFRETDFQGSPGNFRRSGALARTAVTNTVVFSKENRPFPRYWRDILRVPQ
jgi:hypothetical protein